MKQHPTWIRVAGNATKIKAGSIYGWRCYIEGNPNEIALTSCIICGLSNERNVIWSIKAAGDSHGLVAWIDCFGSYTIRDDVLYIVLQEPDSSLANA